MNAVPEKGRDTTGEGRAIGPARNDQLGQVGSCVSSFSRHRQIGFARSLTVKHPLVEAHERCFCQTQQPPGGSETLRCASAVGPARAPSDRDEGGPTGTTDLPGGTVRWAVGASVCGALGCVETEGLVEVEQDGKTRVLCLDHARRWSA